MRCPSRVLTTPISAPRRPQASPAFARQSSRSAGPLQSRSSHVSKESRLRSFKLCPSISFSAAARVRRVSKLPCNDGARLTVLARHTVFGLANLPFFLPDVMRGARQPCAYSLEFGLPPGMSAKRPWHPLRNQFAASALGSWLSEAAAAAGCAFAAERSSAAPPRAGFIASYFCHASFPGRSRRSQAAGKFGQAARSNRGAQPSTWRARRWWPRHPCFRLAADALPDDGAMLDAHGRPIFLEVDLFDLTGLPR